MIWIFARICWGVTQPFWTFRHYVNNIRFGICKDRNICRYSIMVTSFELKIEANVYREMISCGKKKSKYFVRVYFYGKMQGDPFSCFFGFFPLFCQLFFLSLQNIFTIFYYTKNCKSWSLIKLLICLWDFRSTSRTKNWHNIVFEFDIWSGM